MLRATLARLRTALVLAVALGSAPCTTTAMQELRRQWAQAQAELTGRPQLVPLTPAERGELRATLAQLRGEDASADVTDADATDVAPLDAAELAQLEQLLAAQGPAAPLAVLPDGSVAWVVLPPGATVAASGGAVGGAAGWSGGAPGTAGFDPGVGYYDMNEYQDPNSSAYDAYEVESEGWSGGAYDNPSSSSYDGGSFGGFDSYE